MIEKLTKKRLKECGFSKLQITRFYEKEGDPNYESFTQNKEIYFASRSERKIYSGIDSARVYYFRNENEIAFPMNYPDLLPEYFGKRLSIYLNEQRKIAGKVFIEKTVSEEFRQNEIKITERKIKELEQSPLLTLRMNNNYRVLKNYINWLNAIPENKVSHQPETKKPTASLIMLKPLKFSELFINPQIINDCINLLKETDKPCVNEDNEFIRNKGAFVVWFNALEQKKVFNSSFINDIERAKTLNYNFKGLGVSGSLFRQGNKRASENYKTHFENEIATIKH